MIGCSPLTKHQIELINSNLKYIRDKTLFNLMLYTGFRISEILSIKVSDVINKDRLTIERKNMKGKINSRNVIIHPICKALIGQLLAERPLVSTNYLFSAENAPNKPISRIRAWKIINDAAKKAELSGKIGLHSTRKTFANEMYEKLGKDLLKTCKALGHRNINSTISYLSFKTEEIDNSILSIDLSKEIL